MRKIFFVVFLFTAFTAKPQFNWDYGLSLGMSTYMGDIGGPAADPIRFQMARGNYGAGLFLRYKASNSIYIKGSFNYINISGADSLSASPGRIARNLHFRNAIMELAITPEFHIYQTKDFGRTGRYTTFFNTYIFGGVGLALHNPQAKLGNKWVNLQPLQTEGVSYSKMIPVFPLGVGAHFTFKRKLRIGMELGIRLTMFDYLDDVSDEYLTAEELADIDGDETFLALQDRVNVEYINDNPDLFIKGYRQGGAGGGIRGNPDSKDWYFFGSANIGYVIKGSSNFYRSRYNYSRGRKKSRRRSRAKF